MEGVESSAQPVFRLPLSGRSIGQLAADGFGVLWRTQWLIAVLSAVCLGLLAWTAWVPVIERAARALPDEVALNGGQLKWPTAESRVLSESPFLGFAVELNPEATTSRIADIQLVLGAQSFTVQGLFGAASFPYPPTVQIETGRVAATAWWGAWNWVVVLGFALSVVFTLMGIWWVLATFYWPVSCLLQGLLRQRFALGMAWKLAAAALLLGALVISLGTVMYTFMAIRVPGLLAFFALHLLAGWLGLAWGVLYMPRVDTAKGATASNPFGAPPKPEPEPELEPKPAVKTKAPRTAPPPKPQRPQNPFSR